MNRQINVSDEEVEDIRYGLSMLADHSLELARLATARHAAPEADYFELHGITVLQLWRRLGGLPVTGAHALLAEVRSLRECLLDVERALDEAERAGGDAPHRCVKPADRIRVVAGLVE